MQEIKQLSESYVPEWKFDTENPDIGSVISMIYARQMMDNVDKYNDALEQFRVEFVNMLGVSLRPAIPAGAMVTLQLAEDSMAGVPVERGVKLLAATEKDEPVVFETEHPIYVTASRLVQMFMTSARIGKVLPLYGVFQPPYYIDKPDEQEYQEYPFGLFEFRKTGIEKHGLLLYHSHLFDVENSNIILRLEDSAEFMEGLKRGQYRILYYGEEGFTPFTQVEIGEAGALYLQKDAPCKKVEKAGQSYSVILLEACENPTQTVGFRDIRISSFGTPVEPEFVNNGSLDLDVREFRPFGDTLALYEEVYIGANEYFHKPGARITIRFQLRLEDNPIYLTKHEEEEALKIIKRKPRVLVTEVMADAYADEVVLEYYNGTGWKRLECGRT